MHADRHLVCRDKYRPTTGGPMRKTTKQRNQYYAREDMTAHNSKTIELPRQPHRRGAKLVGGNLPLIPEYGLRATVSETNTWYN